MCDVRPDVPPPQVARASVAYWPWPLEIPTVVIEPVEYVDEDEDGYLDSFYPPYWHQHDDDKET